MTKKINAQFITDTDIPLDEKHKTRIGFNVALKGSDFLQMGFTFTYGTREKETWVCTVDQYPFGMDLSQFFDEVQQIGFAWRECITNKKTKRRPSPKVVETTIARIEHFVCNNEQNIINKAYDAYKLYSGVQETPKDDTAQAELEEQRKALEAEKENLRKQQESFDIMRVVGEKTADTIAPLVMDSVREQVKEEFGGIIDCMPKQLEVKIGDFTHKPKKQVYHGIFEKVLSLVAGGANVWLYGEAGTGKSHIARQIAEVLEWEYRETGCILDVNEGFKGFIDANGNEHGTQFTQALELAESGKNVVFCMDEADGGTPEIMNALNSFLDNGCIECMGHVYHMTDMKEHLRIIACGNTNGRGGDGRYARNIMDDATLNRFIRIPVDYDRGIEMSVSGGNEELVDFIDTFRKVCVDNRIQSLVTYRAIKYIGMTEDVVHDTHFALQCTLLDDMGESDVVNVHNQMESNGMKGNKYVKALVA